MPEPLKNVYDEAFIKDLSTRLSQSVKKFRAQKFVQQVLAGDWQDLELKNRMSRIADVIHEHLSDDFRSNAESLIHVAQSYRQNGKTGFEYMFLPDYIEKHGQNDFSVSMKALAAITETGSAEFAIRPFIKHQETKALKQLIRWAKSKDEHLRRLASEGCRPRLPWAMALPAFKQDPAPILPILEQLKNDESLYVRRSVANNLNDISKDNPDIALDLAERWHGLSEETDWLVKHACRGLLKAGDPRALELFGFASPEALSLKKFKLSTKQINFGDTLEFGFELHSEQPLGTLRLDYGVDFVKANGSLSRKVFKISELESASNKHVVTKQHKFVPISTRVHYPGTHQLAMIVNGVELASKKFELLMK